MTERERPDLYKKIQSDVGDARAAITWARNTTSMLPSVRRWCVRRALELAYFILERVGAAVR